MNYAKKTGKIWYDGQWVDWQQATTHVLTHTLHYGMGAYEGIRCYQTPKGPAIFRLDDHIHRLFDSAKLMNIKLTFSYEEIYQACLDVIPQNKLSSAYIRPLVFLGSEGMGLRAENLQAHAIVAAWEWGAYLGDEGLKHGIKIKTSSFKRNDINSMMAKAKVNGHYVNSMLALQEAQSCGFDEALMLDGQGYVAEGSGENFFMIKNGVVYTPLPGNILCGITRETIIQLCHQNGLKLVETHVTRDQVYLADEAFFTGTAAEVTPIRQLDHCIIGQGRMGPITQQLQRQYFDIVEGRDADHSSWLHYHS